MQTRSIVRSRLGRRTKKGRHPNFKKNPQPEGKVSGDPDATFEVTLLQAARFCAAARYREDST